ncbi:MAG: M20/M25/M40 family metallo-hydrolase [Bacteroidota bacterium]
MANALTRVSGMVFLRATQYSGITLPGSPQTNAINVSAKNLVAGSYTNNIVAIGNDTINKIKIVPVQLTVLSAPLFSASPTSLNWGWLGGLTKEDSITVTNTGQETLSISSVITDNPDLSVLPSSGDIYPGAQKVFYVSLRASIQGAGTGNIIFTHNAPYSPAMVHISYGISYTINASAGTNGSINPSGAVSAVNGANVHFSIIPAAGYHVDSLLVDGTPQKTDTQYTFQNVLASHSIRATFAINTYTIYASGSSYGTITPGGSTTVNYGGNPHFSMIPDTGYGSQVESLYIDGISVLPDTQYTFTNVSASHTIYVLFGIPKNLPVIAVNANLQNFANQVSVTSITNVLRKMDQFKTRYVLSPDGLDSLAKARDWFIAKLQSYGYSDIVQQDFTYQGNTLENIIVTKTGTRYPDTMIVLGAHYDSMNCPGTDDDGTGDALVLEAARILANRNCEYTIKLILFSAEEEGLVGSNAFVQSIARPQNYNIRLMINIDMVGYSGGRSDVWSLKDYAAAPAKNALSALFCDTLAAMAEMYSPMPTKIGIQSNSDFAAFQVVGVPTTGFFETIRTPHYHLPSDSLIYVDTNYAAKVIRGAVAGLAYFARSIPIITASAGNNGIITPTGIINADTITTQHFSISPNPGYHVDSLIIDGALVTSDTQYTFAHVNIDHSIQVTFAVNAVPTTRTSVATGNWNSIATWSGGVVPTSIDSVIIGGGYTVTLNVNNAACSGMEIGSPTSGGGAGTLIFNSSSQLTVTRLVHLGNASSRTGSINMTNGGTLICNAITVTNLGTWTPGTGTVQLNTNNTLPAALTTYNNLIINSPSTSTLGVATTITGNLVISSGATLSVGTSNFALNVAGDWLNNGTFTAGTGTVTINGTAQDTIGGSASTAFNTLTISNSIGVRLTSNITEAGNLSITAGNFDLQTFTANRTAGGGTLTVGAGATLTIGGTNTMPANFTTHTFNATSTINYDGVSQTISSENYAGNLTLSGSGTKTLQTGTTTIGGNLTLSGTDTATTVANLSITSGLTVGSGALFTVAGFNISVTGSTSVTGTLAFSSPTGTKTFTGNVTINSGGAWSETASPAFSFAGNLQNSGILTSNTGVHTFSGATKTFSGTNAISIPSATITGTYTNNGVLTVGTALAGAGGLTQGAAVTDTLNLGGTSTITTLTATGAGNTVNYYGVAQTVHSNNYYNLTLSGSGAKTLQTGTTTIGGNLTLSGTATATTVVALAVTGNFSVGSGATFTVAGFNISVSGSTSVAGTLTHSNATGTKTYTGNVTINSGAIWNDNAAVVAISFGGNLQNDGTMNAGTGVHTFSGSSKTISGANPVSIPNVTISGTTTNNGVLTISTALAGSSTLINGAAGILNLGQATAPAPTITSTAAGNTVNYNAAGAQTLKATTYSNLTLNGSGAKTVTGSTINGTLSLQGAATTAGTIPAYGSNATIQYAGSGSQTTGIEMSSTVAPNVNINNSNSVILLGSKTFNDTLTFTSGRISTGANTLTAGIIIGANSNAYVYGNLLKTFPTGGPTTRTFEVGDAAKYAPVSITINNVSIAGSLTAKTTGAEHPNIGTSGLLSAKDVNRYWILTNTGMSFDNYSTTLNWNASDIDPGADTATFQVAKFNSPNWTLTTSSGQTGTGITTSGLTSFSDFAVGNLASFTITADAGTNGTISPTGTVGVANGANQHFSITPNAGYHVDSLVVDGVPITPDTQYTFNNVTSNHAIHAHFAINTFMITASAGLNGIISPNGTTIVNYNGSQHFSIIPGTGYHVDSLIIDGTSVTTDTQYTFSSVQTNHTIHVAFRINSYTVTASVGANGGITPSGIINANYGSNVHFSISPNTGYHVDSLIIDGIPVAADTQYTFSTIQTSHTIHVAFRINSYTVTASAGTNGGITPSGIINANYGSSVHFSISPNTGYHVDSLIVNGTTVAADTQYTFNNVQTNHTIHVAFRINSYTVSASAGTNGGITPNGIINANYGSNVHFSIVPNTGYHVDSLIVDGTTLAADTQYTFSNVQTNHTIHVAFRINSYTVTASAGANGTITPTGITNANYDSSVHFSISPNTGYHVDSLIVDGTTLATDTQYTFNNVQTNHIIHVAFRINSYTVTASAGANGTLTPSGIIYANYGSNVHFSIAPTTGYHIDSLIVDGSPVTPDTQYTFSNVQANHTFRATFAVDVYTITASWSGPGYMTPTYVYSDINPFQVSVNYGDSATVYLWVGTDSKIDSIFIDGVSQPLSNMGVTQKTLNVWGVNSSQPVPYTFHTVTANHFIRVVFDWYKFTLNVTAGPHGTISPSGTLTYPMHSIVHISIVPDTGYHVDSLIVDGAPIPPDTQYNVPSQDYSYGSTHSIRATFAVTTFTIISSADLNGTILPTPSVVVNFGASQHFSIVPHTGYHVDSLLVDGTPIAADTQYTFSHVQVNHSIHAAFRINSYTITPSVGANGNINPSGSFNANYGSNVHFSISPNTGYHVDSLIIDGTPLAADTQYTFSHVQTNHTIHVAFRINSYTVTASAGVNGTITPSGIINANYGSAVHFSISPNTGYHVDSLIVDGNPVAADTQYTFSNAQTNHTIHAAFRINSYTVTASAGANGSITPTGIINANYGSNVQFSISPKTGYHVDSLIIDGTPVAADTQYTISNVQTNHTIHVAFRINSYTVTSSAGLNGTITPSGIINANYGSAAHFSIAPNTGYHVDSLIIDGTPVAADTQYTFNNVQANHSIRATFAVNVYTITASWSGPGYVTPTYNYSDINPFQVNVNYGDSATVYMWIGTDTKIDSIFIDGVSQPLSNLKATQKPLNVREVKSSQPVPYTFHNVTTNHFIRVVFDWYKFTLNVTAGPHGTIYPNGTLTYPMHSLVHISIVPDTGYHVDSLIVDGTSIPPDTQYDVPSQDYSYGSTHSIRATFAINVFMITSSAGAHGTISPMPSVNVNYGAAQAFIMTPAVNYHIDSIVVDGVYLGSSSPYTITNVTAAHTIHVTFAINMFTITTFAGPHGSISPSGSVTVIVDSNQTFTITPNPGFVTDSIIVDGLSQVVATGFTFNTVTTNHTIRAVFISGPEEVSIIPSGLWSDTLTWSKNAIPSVSDSVIISSGTTITLDINGTCGAINVQGNLFYSNNSGRTLTVSTAGLRSGSVIISDSVVFASQASQRIFVGGDFNNSGTLVNNSTGSTGSFIIFNGTGSKNLICGAQLRGLQMSNAGLNLTLTSPLTIQMGVTLSNGKIILGNNNLTLLPAANISGGSAASYIVTNGAGKLIQYVTTAPDTFPVGTLTGFNRVTLSTQTRADTFGIRILSSVNPPSSKDSAAIQRTVDISRSTTDSVGSITMTFQWNGSEEGTAFVRNTAASWRHNSTAWVEDGTYLTPPSGSNPYVGTITNILNMGRYVIGNPGELPITLSEFRGASVDAHSVLISWSTVSEQNTYGFYVQRRSESSIEYADASPLIAGAGSSLVEHFYSWTDTKANKGTYFYRLRTVNLNGDVEYSTEIRVTNVLGVQQKNMLPTVFKLNQNYPNPFNPSTNIQYQLPKESRVNLSVFNILGQKVTTLVDGVQSEGYKEVSFNASNLPSGIYFYRMQANNFTDVKKFIIMK